MLDFFLFEISFVFHEYVYRPPESDPWALARACIDYGRLLEDAAAALPGADKQSPADHTRRVQLLARAVLAYRSALAGGLPPPPPVKLGASASSPSNSQTSPAAHSGSATIEERQDEARLYFALASAQFSLSEQFAPPPAPATDATDATDEDADGAGIDSAPASAPPMHAAASAPKAPTASAWWLALLDAPDLFAPSSSDNAGSPSTKSSSAASSTPAESSSAAAAGPPSADIVEAESAMTALIASRLGTGTGGARLDPEAQAALLFAAERSMRVAASCALQVYMMH
jgi:hypothetical protein